MLRRSLLAAAAALAALPAAAHDYTAGDIASRFQADLSNTRRLLQRLVTEGLVLAERCFVLHQVKPRWNRERLVYWNAATAFDDRMAADDWHAGREARSEAARDLLFERFFG